MKFNKEDYDLVPIDPSIDIEPGNILTVNKEYDHTNSSWIGDLRAGLIVVKGDKALTNLIFFEREDGMPTSNGMGQWNCGRNTLNGTNIYVLKPKGIRNTNNKSRFELILE